MNVNGESLDTADKVLEHAFPKSPLEFQKHCACVSIWARDCIISRGGHRDEECGCACHSEILQWCDDQDD